MLPNGSRQLGIHELAKGLKSNLGKKDLASALNGDGVWGAVCSVMVDAFSMARSINGLSGTYCASSSLWGFTVVAVVFHPFHFGVGRGGGFGQYWWGRGGILLRLAPRASAVSADVYIGRRGQGHGLGVGG
eukprot:scaffold29097_cov43-Cyclotella_meneghiniana.AAC.1